MAAVTTLPAAFVSGNVLTADQLNNVRGAFRVLQVVSATYSTAASNSTTTYADTGLTATITPSSTSSKVLVYYSQNGCGKEAGNLGSECVIGLLRGASVISYATGASNGTSSVNYIGSISQAYLDSPATTSATTYKTQFKNYVNAASVRVQTSNTAGDTSTIILMEISA
jgi:hypothetical protein